MSAPGTKPRAIRGEAWSQLMQEHEVLMHSMGAPRDAIRLRRHYVRLVSDHFADPSAVTAGGLIEVLAAQNWAKSTRKSARTQLRQFFAWAHAVGHLPTDPAAGLPSVLVPAGRPRPTPDQVMRRALERATARERLMLLLGILAGLRRAEIARVHSRDVEGDQLVVRGKGGRTRVLPLHPALVEALAGLDGWAFPHPYRPEKPIGAAHVGALLTRLLDGHSPHTLRHAFASRAYAVQRDILAVQQLLGHASVATTMVYTQVPTDALRTAVFGPTGFGV